MHVCACTCTPCTSMHSACTHVCLHLHTHSAHTCSHGHVTTTRLRASSNGLDLGKTTAPRGSGEPMFSVPQFKAVKAKCDMHQTVRAQLPIPSPGTQGSAVPLRPLPFSLLPPHTWPCPRVYHSHYWVAGWEGVDMHSFPLWSQETAQRRPHA